MKKSNRLPPWMRKKTSVALWLKRLNIIFRAAYTDLRRLENGEWQRLLDDLYFAIFNAQRKRDDMSIVFNRVVKDRPAVWDALGYLKGELDAEETKRDKDENPFMSFEIQKHTMKIRYVQDSWGGMFEQISECNDFASMLYIALGHILNASMITKYDLRECSNPTCKTPFAPSRKISREKAAYCTPRCARIVAARNYRASKKKKGKQKKKKR